jgi:hypothetical protein
MRLVWVSDDRERFAFVNERGQKIAELSAVQLARQLSRGAQPPTKVDEHVRAQPEHVRDPGSRRRKPSASTATGTA